MSEFQARSVELRGSFRLERPAAEAFELFSPLGEELWVPGWSPELLHPPGATWERDQIFRTAAEGGDVVWLVLDLDRAAHRVEYHRVEPERYVARVKVRCEAAGDAASQVHTSYSWVGLSDAGNSEILGMSQATYDEKMRQWKRWIDDYFARRA